MRTYTADTIRAECYCHVPSNSFTYIAKFTSATREESQYFRLNK